MSDTKVTCFVVSAGMAGMANELYEHLEPHIKRAKSAGQAVCFGVHSLGGALATLFCRLALLKSQLPSHQLQCVTFGSPSVLAHTDGKDGNAILQVGSAHADSNRSTVHILAHTSGVCRPVHAGQPMTSFLQPLLESTYCLASPKA